MSALSDNIQQANYEGVVFPVANADTEGGNDGAMHTSYGRRGADIEPTGLKAYGGSMVVPLINGLATYGTLFPDRYRELIDKFQTTPIGFLAHPTKGTFTAFISSWSESVAPDVQNGIILTVHWAEHNGEAGILLNDQGSTPQDSPQAARALANAADSSGSSQQGYTLTAPVIATQIAFLETALRTPNEILASINTMVATVTANIALASLASATQHATVATLNALQATIYRLRDRYLPQYAQFRTYTTTQTMSLWQVAKIVYGDASLGGLISAVNAVNDPLFIRAGTTLTILPAPT